MVRLLLLVISFQVYALSLEEIKTKLKEGRKTPLSYEAEFNTIVQVGNNQIVTKSHLWVDGEEKMRLEVSNSMQNQVIIKNGEKMMMKDLKTGRSTIMEASEHMKSPTNLEIDELFASGIWLAPELNEKGQWLLKGQGTSGAQELYYNPETNVIEEMVLFQGGQVISTKFDWCLECPQFYPKSINVETILANGQISRVKIEYLKFEIPNGFVSKLFEVE